MSSVSPEPVLALAFLARLALDGGGGGGGDSSLLFLREATLDCDFFLPLFFLLFFFAGFDTLAVCFASFGFSYIVRHLIEDPSNN